MKIDAADVRNAGGPGPHAAFGEAPQQVRRIRSEDRATLVASIARSRRWLNELITESNGERGNHCRARALRVRKVNMTLSLAFLAPDLVKAAIDGRLPHGMGVARLADLPAEWSRSGASSAFLASRDHIEPSRSNQSLISGKRKFPAQRQNRETALRLGRRSQRHSQSKEARQLRAFLSFRKSPFARECVVADAVQVEPVCAAKIPDNREI